MLFVERNDVEFYIVLSLGEFVYFFPSMFTVILQKLYDGVVGMYMGSSPLRFAMCRSVLWREWSKNVIG